MQPSKQIYPIERLISALSYLTAGGAGFVWLLIANVYYMSGQIERSIYSYRAAVNMRPENDEYKLVFIQVLDDFVEDYRKEDIVAAF